MRRVSRRQWELCFEEEGEDVEAGEDSTDGKAEVNEGEGVEGGVLKFAVFVGADSDPVDFVGVEGRATRDFDLADGEEGVTLLVCAASADTGHGVGTLDGNGGVGGCEQSAEAIADDAGDMSQAVELRQHGRGR